MSLPALELQEWAVLAARAGVLQLSSGEEDGTEGPRVCVGWEVVKGEDVS